MNPCDDYIVQTLRYLVNDLKGAELEQFRSHLRGCADCRAHLAEEEALSKTLVRSRPLYSAPDALRSRVLAAATQQHLPSHTLMAGAFERLSIWRVSLPAAQLSASAWHWFPPLSETYKRHVTSKLP